MEKLDGSGGHAAPEPDQALAVAPDEVVVRD
jgi:hypothetical protein